MKSKTTITTETWQLTRIDIIRNGTVRASRTITRIPLAGGEKAVGEMAETECDSEIESDEGGGQKAEGGRQ